MVFTRELVETHSLRFGIGDSDSSKVNKELAYEYLFSLRDQDDRLEWLDQQARHNTRAFKLASYCIHNTDAELVVSEFGVETAFWAFHETRAQKLDRALQATLISEWDMDLITAREVRDWQRFQGQPKEAANALAQYRHLQYIYSQSTEQIDLPYILSTSALPGVSLSKSRLSDYSLTPLGLARDLDTYKSSGDYRATGTASRFGHHKPGDKKAYEVFLDAPAAIALLYKDEPQALVSTMLDVDESALFINQLQGIRGCQIKPGTEDSDFALRGKQLSARGLAPLDWRKTMLSVAEQVAINAGYKSVTLQSGTNNYWTLPQSPDKDPHLSQEQAIIAYDKPAARLGFTLNDQGNWSKPLT